MSRAAGFPGWGELIEKGIQFAEREQCEIDGAQIRRLIGSNKLLLAGGLLRRTLGEPLFARFLLEVFHRRVDPTPAHSLLTGLSCIAILTTNYDRLIEAASPISNLPIQPDNEAQLAQVCRGELRGAVVKVHGDITDTRKIVFASEDYRNHLFGNGALSTTLETFFNSRTCVFLGYGLRDPDITGILDELSARTKGHTGPHYALVRTGEFEPEEIRQFTECYRVEVIDGYDRDGYPDIAAFLGALRGPPQVSDAELRDIESLLGLQPFQKGVRFLERAGDRALFSVTMPAGFRDMNACFCYTPRAPVPDDFRSWPEEAEMRVLVSAEPAAAEVAEAAGRSRIDHLTRSDLVTRLGKFGEYLKKLQDEYEQDQIDKFFVPLNLLYGPQGSEVQSLDSFIEHWLEEPGANLLSLLGSFGTGKSWFCRRLACQAAVRHARDDRRIPILIRLREHPSNMKALLAYALDPKFGVELSRGMDSFDRLNIEGRLLLIFDGFDEMERRANDYKTAVENFEQIARLVTPRSKVILTCRTEFFQNRAQERATAEEATRRLEPEKTSQSFGIHSRPGFEIAYLAKFTPKQVQEALRRRAPEQWKALWEKVTSLPKTAELTDRPVLIRMIVETMDQILHATDLNLATLYEGYTARLLAERSAGSIPPDKRLFFVTELAWDMMDRDRAAVPFSAFPDLVKEHFGLGNDAVKAAVFEQDIRNHSYLERDAAGNYEFPHKSIMEYFVARKLAPMLARGERVQVRLTDAVVSFMPDLLRDYEYPKRMEDGMVWVPPGPFIYGCEEEKNLRVGYVESGFWMDRCPVTNARFLRFLQETGNRKESGVTWLDHNGSRIKKEQSKFTIMPGYDEHPVTGVSWYGARAFAAWDGRKRLPAELEWEKAARGIDGRTFPWGEDRDVKQRANVEGVTGDTTPVARYCAGGRSPYGCDDVAGNVWEWTASPWAEGGKRLVVRGGSWGSDRGSARCAFRGSYGPERRGSYLGFRCART
jgi:formylglycine-generating enzyme required for sulfatase activity